MNNLKSSIDIGRNSEVWLEVMNLIRFLTLNRTSYRFISMTLEDFLSLHLRRQRDHQELKVMKALNFQMDYLASISMEQQIWATAIDLGYHEYIEHKLSSMVCQDEIAALLNTLCPETGKAPLHRALERQHSNLARSFLKYGANPEQCSSDGRNALYFAIENGSLTLFHAVLEHLQNDFEQQSKWATSTTYPLTLVHVAAKYGNDRVLAYLCEKFPLLVDQPSSRSDKWTPLHYAISNGSAPCVSLLLQNQASISYTTPEDQNHALHRALVHHGPEVNDVLDLLLRHASPRNECMSLSQEQAFWNQKNHQGFAVLHLAIMHHHELAIRLIREHGWGNPKDDGSLLQLNETPTTSRTTPSRTKADDRSPDVRGRIDLNGYSSSGASPLHLSITHGKHGLKVLRCLLESQDILVDIIDNEERTPLVLASTLNKIEMMKLLIFRGANASHQDQLGLTTLHYAAAEPKFDSNILILLLSSGMNVDIRSNLLNTPLHVAAMNNNVMAARVLVLYGAELDLVNQGKVVVVCLVDLNITDAEDISYSRSTYGSFSSSQVETSRGGTISHRNEARKRSSRGEKSTSSQQRCETSNQSSWAT